MKSKLYILNLLIFFLIIGACSDKEQGYFEGASSVHFNLSSIQKDSIVYSFVNTTADSMVINLPIELTGYADKDYTFSLKVDKDKTTAVNGVDYRISQESFTFPKGVYHLDVPITLLCSEQLEAADVKLVVTLIAGVNLETGIDYRQKATLIISNQLPPIPEWSSDYSYLFGTYSKVKHRYILSVTGIGEIIQFEDSEQWYSLPRGKRQAYSILMNNFFAENIIYDENGNRILPWL